MRDFRVTAQALERRGARPELMAARTLRRSAEGVMGFRERARRNLRVQRCGTQPCGNEGQRQKHQRRERCADAMKGGDAGARKNCQITLLQEP